MDKHFPINFFRSIFSVEKIFSIRSKINWVQLVLVFVFIQSLLLIPLSLGISQRGVELADDILPQEFSVSEPVASKINQLNFLEGRLVTDETTILTESATFFIGINVSDGRSDNKMGMNFEQDFVDLTIEGTEGFHGIRLIYTDTFIEDLREEPVYEALQTAIYQQNAASIFLSRVVNIGMILLSMNGMLIIGVSVLFYLTKRTSAIKTFKESLTLALALMSGGVLLATLIGFLTTDIFILFGVQSLWLVVMTILLFVKTRFKQVRSQAEVEESLH
ncbi:hypothetical protein [Enterococcus olivae]